MQVLGKGTSGLVVREALQLGNQKGEEDSHEQWNGLRHQYRAEMSDAVRSFVENDQESARIFGSVAGEWQERFSGENESVVVLFFLFGLIRITR